jgi:hypothetical protein
LADLKVGLYAKSKNALALNIQRGEIVSLAKAALIQFEDDGAAAVPLASVIAALRSGQSMTLDPSCGDMIPVLNFSPDGLDDFDRWSRRLGG